VATGTEFSVGFGSFDADRGTDVLYIWGSIASIPISNKPLKDSKYQSAIGSSGIKQVREEEPTSHNDK